MFVDTGVLTFAVLLVMPVLLFVLLILACGCLIDLSELTLLLLTADCLTDCAGLELIDELLAAGIDELLIEVLEELIAVPCAPLLCL
jgi:hypothetical protein